VRIRCIHKQYVCLLSDVTSHGNRLFLFVKNLRVHSLTVVDRVAF
jgi:hypothetical protein